MRASIISLSGVAETSARARWKAELFALLTGALSSLLAMRIAQRHELLSSPIHSAKIKSRMQQLWEVRENISFSVRLILQL